SFFAFEPFRPQGRLTPDTNRARWSIPAMSLAIQYLKAGKQLERLPLAILYLTERCNSRCITCDYWRTGHLDMTLDSATRLLPSLVRLETQVVLISGGAPLIDPRWGEIARFL